VSILTLVVAPLGSKQAARFGDTRPLPFAGFSYRFFIDLFFWRVHPLIRATLRALPPFQRGEPRMPGFLWAAGPLPLAFTVTGPSFPFFACPLLHNLLVVLVTCFSGQYGGPPYPRGCRAHRPQNSPNTPRGTMLFCCMRHLQDPAYFFWRRPS